MGNKMTVGSLEACDLPELNIKGLHARIDTGAKTSSLHVDNIVEKRVNKAKWVSFDIHPDISDVGKRVTREARVKKRRTIKSSNGASERRYLIETEITMGGNTWPIEVTLTDRSDMTYLMLLGRQAMVGRIIVDPEFTYLVSEGVSGPDEEQD